MSSMGSIASRALLVLVAAVGIATAPALAAFPGTNGRVAFDTDRTGVVQVGVLNPDGAGFRLLTEGDAASAQPAWSADGLKIAFVREVGSDWRVFVMNWDGTGVTQVTTGTDSDDFWPAWSPDGTKIVFTRADSAVGNDEIWAVTLADGTLVNLSNNSANDRAAVYSPDGEKIAFMTDRDQNWEIYTADAADGASPTNLSNDANVDAFPDWSPDGSVVVFSSNRTGTTFGLFTVPAAGGTPLLIATPENDSLPVYSADGTKFAFNSDRDGNPEIYTMNLDGSDVMRFTDAPGVDEFADWQPVVPGDNQPPVADAGDDQVVECTSPDGALVQLDGTDSTDPDGDIALYEWWRHYGEDDESFLGTGATLDLQAPIGEHLITLQVTDAVAQSARDDVFVEVVDTTPPSILCPESVVVECQSNEQAWVDLPPATASDVCSEDVVITNSYTSNGADASGSYPLGTTIVTFTATDAAGNRAACATSVKVQDTIPPTISVSLTPTRIWPPNHKLVSVRATVVATDICSPVAVVLASVTSSEPDNGLGDGDTANDIQNASIGTADYVFSVRAERSGKGPGRTYTATYTATDTSDNSASASATVFVPHDQGKGKAKGKDNGNGNGNGNGGSGDTGNGSSGDTGNGGSGGAGNGGSGDTGTGGSGDTGTGGSGDTGNGNGNGNGNGKKPPSEKPGGKKPPKD